MEIIKPVVRVNIYESLGDQDIHFLHAEEKSLSSLLLHNLGLPWNMYLICKAHIFLIIL